MKCEVCNEEKDGRTLTPYWNSNINVGYNKVCKDCHNQYDDYFVVMKRKVNK